MKNNPKGFANIVFIGVIVILVAVGAYFTYVKKSEIIQEKLTIDTTKQIKKGDQWDIANEQIKRLKPSDFNELPTNIIRELEMQNCTIPQTTLYPNNSRNVVSGELMKSGQKDWAVLCSKNKISHIVVFWNGSIANQSEIEIGPDKEKLIGQGDNVIAYDFQIEVLNKSQLSNSIKEFEVKYKEYYKSINGMEKAPSINHSGIMLSSEKILEAKYYSDGKWKDVKISLGL